MLEAVQQYCTVPVHPQIQILLVRCLTDTWEASQPFNFIAIKQLQVLAAVNRQYCMSNATIQSIQAHPHQDLAPFAACSAGPAASGWPGYCMPTTSPATHSSKMLPAKSKPTSVEPHAKTGSLGPRCATCLGRGHRCINVVSAQHPKTSQDVCIA